MHHVVRRVVRLYEPEGDVAAGGDVVAVRPDDERGRAVRGEPVEPSNWADPAPKVSNEVPDEAAGFLADAPYYRSYA